jgi:hypothetical protein
MCADASRRLASDDDGVSSSSSSSSGTSDSDDDTKDTDKHDGHAPDRAEDKQPTRKGSKQQLKQGIETPQAKLRDTLSRHLLTFALASLNWNPHCTCH